jgi:predicted phosphodiesterase
MRFLCNLPVSCSVELEGVRIVVWHARPDDDMMGIYPDIAENDAVTLLDAAGGDVLLVGHTHLAFERRVADGRMICNPGALLRDPAEPLDVPARGTFGVLELPAKTFTVRSARTGEVEADTGMAAPWKLVDNVWRPA